VALKRSPNPNPWPFEDDVTILDRHEIWRRVSPKQLVPDPNRGGCLRISSAFFADSTPERSEPPKIDANWQSPMSALLGTEDTLARALRDHAASGLISIKVSVLRTSSLGIERDPTPDDPSHVLVFGAKTPGVKDRLVQAAQWLVGVPGYEGKLCAPQS
jgi:hypothetical protein